MDEITKAGTPKRRAHLPRMLRVLKKEGWFYCQTGGNCTAFEKSIDGGGWYMMTSHDDGCTAPKRMSESIDVGKYDVDGNEVGELMTYDSVHDFFEGKPGKPFSFD